MIAIVDPNDLLLPTAAPCHKKFNIEVNAATDWHDQDNLGGDLKARKWQSTSQDKTSIGK